MFNKSKMFRNILRKSKNIKLGRWNTNKENDTINRQIDLANCDSCGTCGLTDYSKKKVKIKLPLTSLRSFSSNIYQSQSLSSFQEINTKCCCFGDKRKIQDCICMSDFYSEKISK